MRNIPSRLPALALLALLACNTSQPKFAFTHAERRGRLDANGLRFVIMPDPSTQLVEVDVRYEVGSKEDPVGKAGLAHVVEHLMFQLRPEENGPPLMKSINAMTTFFNAYTNWDTTHYMNTARAEQVSDLLMTEAMRLHYGCKTISEEEFLREREVVRNEIRQRQGTAEGQVPQLVLSSVYPKGHAYERMIGGDDAQLTTITLDDACNFIAKYYVPERATVIIAGGVLVDPTIELITKWFGRIAKRTGGDLAAVTPVVAAPGRETFDLDVDRPMVMLAFPLPASNTPDGEAARYGISSAWSRIAQAGQEYDFAYNVNAELLGGELAPVFVIAIELKGMGKLNEALEFTQKATRQAYRGFDEGSATQIEEWNNISKAAFIEGLEPLQSRSNLIGQMVQFSKDFDFDSDELYMFHELDKISKFDGARVGALVKKYIDFDKAKIVIIKPNKEGIKGDKRSTVKFQVQSHDQKDVPDVDPSEARRPLKVAGELKALNGTQQFQLGNGMKVVLLPIKSMPLVAARLVFGNIGDAMLPDNPLLPDAAARFLRLPLDAQAMQKTGISVGCQTSLDETVCGTSGINIYLDVMVKGLERLVKAGTYTQESVERYQKQFRENLATTSAQQSNEIDRQYLNAIYGPDHAYTRTGVQGAGAESKLSKDALDGFRDAHYTAGNATLILTGDFDPKAAEKLVRDTFGGWDKGSPTNPVATAAVAHTGPQVIGVVAKKDEPQVEIRIAYPAPAGVDGQEGARRIMANMMQYRVDDVRFKLGATYGVYAGRQPHKGPTSYQIRGTVDAERAGESLKAMRDGLDQLRTGETFETDFVRARRKIMSTLLGESTMTAELAGRLGFMSTYGLDAKFYNTMLQQVAAAPLAQIRALMKQELDPNHEVIVLLGSRANLEKTFAEAGLEDVKIIEPEYK